MPFNEGAILGYLNLRPPIIGPKTGFSSGVGQGGLASCAQIVGADSNLPGSQRSSVDAKRERQSRNCVEGQEIQPTIPLAALTKCAMTAPEYPPPPPRKSIAPPRANTPGRCFRTALRQWGAVVKVATCAGATIKGARIGAGDPVRPAPSRTRDAAHACHRIMMSMIRPPMLLWLGGRIGRTRRMTSIYFNNIIFIIPVAPSAVRRAR